MQLLAACRRGQVFFTVPSDHYNCPIGCYTHNMPLPEAREPELMNTLSLMANAGYLRIDEVPGIARLDRTPAVTIYAPLAQTPVESDAVLVTTCTCGCMSAPAAEAEAIEQAQREARFGIHHAWSTQTVPGEHASPAE